jgi:hypothetical protein
LLNGIPSAHACAAIFVHEHMLEQYEDGYYLLDKYMQAYECQICAMPGPDEWPNVEGTYEILPPNVRIQTGRLRKARRQAPDEPINPYKISRSGYVVKCGTMVARVTITRVVLFLKAQIKRYGTQRKKKKGKNTSSNVSITFSYNCVLFSIYLRTLTS